VRDYGENKIFRIACGAPDNKYDWTDKVMAIAADYMDAITLHYYTVPGPWQNKGSATDFSEDEYYLTLKKALMMDEIVTNHLNIMSRYDPGHRVGLIVDEWGTWFDVEPGTNPGFLYQQNTMRDALVASVTLDIFNSHSDRVIMANLAQTVNVLQSVILTDGEKMLLTPTYHVFDLYKAHQDAILLGSWIESAESSAGVPQISASASEKDESITLTVSNLSCTQPAEVECRIIGQTPGTATGRLLAGEMHDKNTFDSTSNVNIRPFDGIELTNDGLRFRLPSCAVAEIIIT
jgi:alpha-N-arabinofuranosidase